MSGRAHREDAGIAYVAILFLLIIILALGLTFLLRASTEAAATLGFGEGMEAEYLAEAAVNHAAWRLMYDPSLPTFAEADADDEYQMYNWGGGRYGYNLRPHTATTPAIIRAVGVSGEIITRQAYITNFKSLPFGGIMAVFAPDNSDFPVSINFQESSWGLGVDTVDVGAETRWVTVAGAPISTGVVMATLDDGNDINLAVFDGSAWTSPWEFTTGADRNHRCFDVAYEQASEQPMLVGRRVNGRSPYYSTWDGSSWSTPAVITNPSGSGDIRTVILASNPLSDEIILGSLTSGNDLMAAIWNGTSWSTPLNVSAAMAEGQYRPFNLVCEAQSGHTLLVYCESDNTVDYGTWNGVGTGGGYVGNMGSRGRIVRMACDPTSDYVIMAIVDSSSDLWIGVWNGSSWVRFVEVETSMYSNTMLTVDVAWETGGEEALIFISRSLQSSLIYRRYTKATNSVSGAGTGPAIGGLLQYIESIQALTIPGEDRIIVLAGTTADDLMYTIWDGDGFEVDPSVMLDDDLFDTPKQAFSMTTTTVN